MEQLDEDRQRMQTQLAEQKTSNWQMKREIGGSTWKVTGGCDQISMIRYGGSVAKPKQMVRTGMILFCTAFILLFGTHVATTSCWMVVQAKRYGFRQCLPLKTHEIRRLHFGLVNYSL